MIIAFKDRDKQHMDYSGESDMVFRLSLDDISLNDLANLGEMQNNFMPEADELAEFIYKAYNGNRKIICQCEYGMSRSAGCAAAILQHFEGPGIEIFVDYDYSPSLLVYHKVIAVLERYKNVKLESVQ